jgi:3-dehydroquinate dehydratase-2
MSELLVLSGPNLDQLGIRSPEIYGTQTLGQHIERASYVAAEFGLTIRHLHSNDESALIEALHKARGTAAGIIFNAGALTHTSWALSDALAIFDGPSVEVHLSNPAAREPYRHVSTLASVVSGSIAGFGGLSYELAVRAVAALLA